MSWLTTIFTQSAWLKRAEISILVSSPISHGEVVFLSSVFDKVLIDGDQSLVRYRPENCAWDNNVIFFETFWSHPTRVQRPLVIASSARLFKLRELSVLWVFDTNQFSATDFKNSPSHPVLKHAERVLIERSVEISAPSKLSDVFELGEMLGASSSRLGILLRELRGAAPIEQPDFIVVEYNESVRAALVAGTRSAIQASLFEERSGLASY